MRSTKSPKKPYAAPTLERPLRLYDHTKLIAWIGYENEDITISSKGYAPCLSAGATFMSFFARPNRYLTRGTRLMIHERKLQANVILDGPLTACIANLKAKLNEIIEHSQEGRFAVVGFSLGGALALASAAHDHRISAVLDFFGFVPSGLESTSLPPTLILHGDADRVVPVSNASGIERLVNNAGGMAETHIYPGEGHGFSLAAWPDAISRTQDFLRRHL